MFRPDRLRELRLKNKYTQESLAIKLHTTKGTISNYENGVSAPNHDVLGELANTLRTSTDYLLDITDNPLSNDMAKSQTATNNNASEIPNFANSKDKRDFKKFLDQQEVMFDGVPLTEEDKARVLGFMEGMFWEAKKLNKRKKPTDTNQ